MAYNLWVCTNLGMRWIVRERHVSDTLVTWYKKTSNFIETSVLKDFYILSEPLPLENPMGAATATALYSGGPDLK